MGLVPFVALRFGFLLERAEDVFFAGLDRSGDRQAILLFLGRGRRLHVLVEHHLAVAELFRGDGAVADLAERDDRVFIAVAVDQGLGARGNVARAMRGQKHQREPVWDFFYAIFDGYAGQGVLPSGQIGAEWTHNLVGLAVFRNAARTPAPTRLPRADR